jgi:hypothetical protein
MINGGKMDKYLHGCDGPPYTSLLDPPCSAETNFAVAKPEIMKTYFSLA